MFKTACAFVIGMAASSAFAANVGVSINVGDPSYYGRIDIGNIPQPPQIIYSQPVYVQRVPGNVQPIYLRVPPGDEKNWDRHCRAYNACNRPVYFVRDDWYRQHYVGGHREDDRGRGRGYDRRGDDHRDDQGRGRGDNRGHGHGKDDD